MPTLRAKLRHSTARGKPRGAPEKGSLDALRRRRSSVTGNARKRQKEERNERTPQTGRRRGHGGSAPDGVGTASNGTSPHQSKGGEGRRGLKKIQRHVVDKEAILNVKTQMG